jgi:EmrB/QacA subfamily drug resistance transporter
MFLTEAPTGRARWVAFAVLCSAHLMIVLDISIISMALPSIQSELGFSQSGLAWATNAYTIAYGGLLLLSGRFGDLVGRKRMFVSGVTIFAVASLLCGLANSPSSLIASRFLQGIGAAMAIAVVVAIIFTIFQGPGERAKAVAILSFASAGGASIGLVLGGILTEVVDWRWVFFINVPIGGVAVLLAIPLVATHRGIGIREGVDVPGAVMVTGGLMLGVYTLVQGGDNGWTSARTLGLGAVAVLLLGGFVTRQASAANPLMPLRLFRSRHLSAANVVHFLQMSGVFGFNFLGALYLQSVVGYQPAAASFALLPIAVVMGIASVGLSARLAARFGPRVVLVVGLGLSAAALLLAARTPVEPNYLVDILPMTILLGVGAGIAIPVQVMLAMSVERPADAGLANGLFGTSAMAGGAIGLAVLATLAEIRTERLLAGGESATVAVNSGLHLAFVVSAGMVVAALLAATLMVRSTSATGPPEAESEPGAQSGPGPRPEESEESEDRAEPQGSRVRPSPYQLRPRVREN